MNSTWKQFFPIFIAGGLALAAPAGLFAQNLDEEIQKPAAVREKQAEIEETAEEARQRRAVENGGTATYADVLKDPDDIELNYKYAKHQVASGDLKGASATLERILMVDPALPKVRLFLGIVLYRLDNLDEALRELEAIRSLPMTESLRDEVDAYIDRIHKKKRRTNWNATAGVGYQFDTNRNAAPADGKRLFSGVPLQLNADGLRRSDFSALFLLGAGMEHDLGLQAGHKIFANITYYRAEQVLVDSLDLQVYNYNLGAKLNAGRWGQFAPSLPFDHLLLSQETYLRTYGARLDWDKTLNNKWGLYAQTQASQHDYVKTSKIPTALERTGLHFHLDYGINYNLAPTHRLSAGMGYARQNARRRYNGYDRHKITARHAWLLGKGRFLLSGVTAHFDRYDEPDTVISPNEREDNTVRFNSTFGYPMGRLWKPLENMLWTFTYEYFHAVSNLNNYSYANNKVSTMFTYRWDH